MYGKNKCANGEWSGVNLKKEKKDRLYYKVDFPGGLIRGETTD